MYENHIPIKSWQSVLWMEEAEYLKSNYHMIMTTMDPKGKCKVCV
jgi:hypothetical protein